MKSAFQALLVLAPLCFATQDGAVKTELAKLDGVWNVVGHETDGKAADEEFWRKVQFVFKGDQLTFQGDDWSTSRSTSTATRPWRNWPRSSAS